MKAQVGTAARQRSHLLANARRIQRECLLAGVLPTEPELEEGRALARSRVLCHSRLDLTPETVQEATLPPWAYARAATAVQAIPPLRDSQGQLCKSRDIRRACAPLKACSVDQVRSRDWQVLSLSHVAADCRIQPLRMAL